MSDTYFSDSESDGTTSENNEVIDYERTEAFNEQKSDEVPPHTDQVDLWQAIDLDVYERWETIDYSPELYESNLSKS